MPYYGYSDPDIWSTFTWTERYPSDSELRSYFQHVDDVWDLSKDTSLRTRVVEARFRDNGWVVKTDSGGSYRSKWLIAATGTSLNHTFQNSKAWRSSRAKFIIAHFGRRNLLVPLGSKLYRRQPRSPQVSPSSSGLPTLLYRCAKERSQRTKSTPTKHISHTFSEPVEQRGPVYLSLTQAARCLTILPRLGELRGRSSGREEVFTAILFFDVRTYHDFC